MFLNEESVERDTLRQGDIVKDVHLLGAINLNGLYYSSPAGNPKELASWNVPNKPNFGNAMIVSHSCEIARENKVKVTSIILAPLRDIHKATAKERIDELIKSNLIDQANPSASFLKYFYIAPNSVLEYTDGAIVDFSKIFSVRNKCYDSLLDKKVVQLTEDASSSMALKLALYFHRKGLLAA
ncbi:MAG: hypothetical protein ACTSQ8_25760 [Candidatus Helarchaeota archaeon]